MAIYEISIFEVVGLRHRILMSDKGWRVLRLGSVYSLLDCRADVNAQDNEDSTPLFVAVGTGKPGLPRCY